MTTFLQITSKESKLKPFQQIAQSEWDIIRDEIILLHKNGIIQQKPIEISDKHYHFLGSIFFKAMETGLKRAKNNWFIPHFQNEYSLAVETTCEKITPLYKDRVLSFGFYFNHRDRLNFCLMIEFPNIFFNLLYETKNDLWEHFIKLFIMTKSYFSESVSHDDVDSKILEVGKYGFYKFIKYLISTEIKPFSNSTHPDDIHGTIELIFDAYIDLEELVQKLSKTLTISNKIYSHLMRKHYLKEKKKTTG